MKWTLLVVCVIGSLSCGEPDETPLSKIDPGGIEQGRGEPGMGRSVDGFPLRIGGREFADGLGTHAPGAVLLDLGGRGREFRAWVGVDDEVGGKGTVVFSVWGDGAELWNSGLMKGGEQAKEVEVGLDGVKLLALIVDSGPDGIDYDHADWADAVIMHDGAPPPPAEPKPEEAVVLTPKPGPEPRLTGPQVFGARAGNPFLHRITATGERPMKFEADGLPPGIALDPESGMLTGSLQEDRQWKVVVRATNSRGADRRTLRIEGGDLICLTPPMGWNSWNCFAGAVTDTDIRNAAKAMAESGLADHGWSYINIDDYWQVKPEAKDDASLQGRERDEEGRILPNPRFPDMKALADHVHGLGLKVGIYSSPGPLTCGGCIGSFDHEWLDAQSYVEWGFDYLKYDWCSYRHDLEGKRSRPAPMKNGPGRENLDRARLMVPYVVMRTALDGLERDVVYSLCQYGKGEVSEWGARVGGNCWRTTGDIVDTWESMSEIGFGQAGLEKFAGPGRWNDPDMLVLGQVGWGPSLHPTRLTPNEQYTHISLWCLLSAPLLIGCDLTQLDEFTLGLLTNDEVLEVNQDPLGRQASRVKRDGFREVWAKPMVDGSIAVGLFNRGPFSATVAVGLEELGVKGAATPRDLWRQKDLGAVERELSFEIPRHGCVLVRVEGE